MIQSNAVSSPTAYTMLSLCVLSVGFMIRFLIALAIDGKKIRPSSAKGNNFVQHLDEDAFHALDDLRPVVMGRNVRAASLPQGAVALRQEAPDAPGDRLRRRVVEQQLERAQDFRARYKADPARYSYEED